MKMMHRERGPAAASTAAAEKRRSGSFAVSVHASGEDHAQHTEYVKEELDDYEKWQRTPEASAWRRSTAAEDKFEVVSRPLDDELLSRVMLQLLGNHTRGIPAHKFLDKVHSQMCLDGYKSVLVGIGRTRQWKLVREVIDFVTAHGREQRSAVITSCERRAEHT